MNPLITIGIPFFNVKSTLIDAIRSIFVQSFKDWELILLDDGSQDGSLEIAKSIMDSRVSIISDGKNKGLPYRLNQIISIARGEYIARMDADDLMHPERLKMQVEYLNNNPQIDVVGTAMYSIDEHGFVRGMRGCSSIAVQPQYVLEHGVLAHPTIMGRTEWFRKNLYDPVMIRSQDRELWVRSFLTSRFANINDPLYFYRENQINISKYIKNCQADRYIFKVHGPKLVGNILTYKAIIKSYLKEIVYRICFKFNVQTHIVAMRNRSISNFELNKANNAIITILAAHIPVMCKLS